MEHARENLTKEEITKRRAARKARRRPLDSNRAIFDRRSMLRVKAKTLMYEIRTIRKEEERTRTPGLFWELRHHRDGLSVEARATHIANGLLRGRTISQMESGRTHVPAHIGEKAIAMLRKYGGKCQIVTDKDGALTGVIAAARPVLHTTAAVREAVAVTAEA